MPVAAVAVETPDRIFIGNAGQHVTRPNSLVIGADGVTQKERSKTSAKPEAEKTHLHQIMVLNGDGKSNICTEDSLVKMAEHEATYSVLLCNPPFGIKIVEKRFAVLRHFDLGHEWKRGDDGRLAPSEKVLKSQEMGLLFAELCVRQTAPGGRIGIIMPNGYLGNKSTRYLAFREWLLRHTRLVAVIGFPRFTFKKSGADVSASVLVLERREDALAYAVDADDYAFHAGLLESVGWSAGDKRAEAVYRRDMETGEMVLDPNNEPILDAD